MMAKYRIYNRIAIYGLLLIGTTLILGSAIYASSFLVIAGIALIFWAIILQYLMPVKHIPLTFLNAVAKSAAENIERILIEFNLTQKAVYLPPKNITKINSGLIFIPHAENTTLPTIQETSSKSLSNLKKGSFLTPPGLAFSQVIEQEYPASFITSDFKTLNSILPRIIVQNLSLAESFKMVQNSNLITIEITNSLLNDICRGSDNQPRTHSQVGCLLSSALACIFAKTMGKPITIQSESIDVKSNLMTIVYKIEE